MMSPTRRQGALSGERKVFSFVQHGYSRQVPSARADTATPIPTTRVDSDASPAPLLHGCGLQCTAGLDARLDSILLLYI